MRLGKRSGRLALASTLLLTLAATSCGTKATFKPYQTFTEMDDPTADTLSDWTSATERLSVSFVPVNDQFPRSVFPAVDPAFENRISGWKGETVSAQLILWSGAAHDFVECEVGDFTDGKNKIAASNAQARFVRYVMTDEFASGCGYRKPEDFASSLVPDLLDTLPYYNVPERMVRPVWITVDIPANAAAGTYLAPVTVSEKGKKVETLTLELVVSDRTLPQPSEWKYFLDLWQHPSAVARVAGVEMWSDEHFELLKPQMKMLADAGQKVITTTMNIDPWNVQTLDPYADMITWTRKADGTWEYDYAIFDRWVELMMDLGIDQQINCYSVLPWDNKLHYFDVVKDTLVDVRAVPGSDEFYEMWKPFLRDFIAHLQSKGWLEITSISMDERSPRDMGYTLELLAVFAPELGIAFADNHKSYKRYPDIRNLCVKADLRVDAEDIDYRKEKGLITTYYVCCADPFPNMFTCSDPAEGVYAALYAKACDYDGFLRWAVNSWVEDPERDSRFRTWPAGDTYMVYPGARSSIRFERVKEGVVFAEKIRILREQAATDNALSAKVAEVNQTLAGFGTLQPENDWKSQIELFRQLLNE